MTKLTKFSENNLRVIQNFLLYAGLEDQYTQSAIDYVSEDHVDGEGSPQALIEKALECELVLEEIFAPDDINEEFPCNVYYDSETKLFYVVSYTLENHITLFKLDGDQEEISTNHRLEILRYRLSVVTKDDEVSIGDIFMHGKFINELG